MVWESGVTCALCLEERALVGSHIIPEFFYRHAYDNKHRIAKVTRGVEQPKLMQKGMREQLLCASCERLLNDNYERDVSRTWMTFMPTDVTTPVVHLDVPEPRKFELFHLSILWRASQASGSEWASVSLGAKHSEILRTSLLNQRLPTGASYPIFATMFIENKAPAMRWIGAPTVRRHERAFVYSTLYGGFMWHVVVASHSVVPESNPYHLSPEGRLVAPVFPVSEMPTLNLRPRLRARRDELRSM